MFKIDTGYQPQFGLGALYQGENAADTEQFNQLDMIKQALANLRDQQSMPIDLAQKQQNLDMERYKTSPDYQQAMTDMMVGQGMSNLSAGQTAKALQPFKQKAEQSKLVTDTNDANQVNKLQEMDAYLSGVDLDGNPIQMNPQTRAQLQQYRDAYADRLSQTIPWFGKKNLEDVKGEWDLKKAMIAAEARASNAKNISDQLRLSFAKSPPATQATTAYQVTQTGIDPFDGHVLDEEEQKKWKAIYDQVTRTLSEQARARSANTPDIGSLGIKTNPNPNFIPDSAGNQNSMGQTSSGVKFKIVQ